MSSRSKLFRHFFRCGFPLFILAAAWPSHGATYYVTVGGDDTRAGTSADTSFATVAHALDVAQDGDIVSIAEGTYSANASLSITKAVTVQGAGMDKTILTTPQSKDERNGYRTVYINHKDALLEGVTISGGRSPSAYYTPGQGVFIDTAGGTVSRCRITENYTADYSAFYTKGAVAIYSSNGRLLNSIVDHNWGARRQITSAGGIYLQGGGLVENCLVYANRAATGGGIFVANKGIIRNCTIFGNRADKVGGGIYWEGIASGNFVMENTILAGNQARNDDGTGTTGWAVAKVGNLPAIKGGISNCLFADSPVLGTNSISGDPAFVDIAQADFSLFPGSPAIDAGVAYEGMAETDLRGKARVQNGTVDIGCHEFDASVPACGVTATPSAFFEGGEVALAPVLRGIEESEGLTYQWTLRSEQGNEAAFTGKNPSGTLAKAGWYDVTLTVGDATGTLATHTRPRYVHVAARTNYVAPAGVSTPAYPWDTEATAANDLQEVVAETIEGSTVLIAAGEYKLPDEIFLDYPVSLIGAGIDKTVLTVASPNQATRLLWLNHPDAVVQDMTLKKGCHGGIYDDPGNGVLIGKHGGVLRHCRVTECVSRSGVYYHVGTVAILCDQGLVSRCVIDHNDIGWGGKGGGLYIEKGIAEDSLILDNWSENHGGGVFLKSGGTLRNCTVVGNSTKSNGGGLYVNYASLNAPVTLLNNIFADNKAPNDVGPGAPEWCLNNNNADYLALLHSNTTNCLFATSAATGVGARSGEPGFVNVATNDFSLLPGSQAIDNGVNYEGAAELDIRGAARVQNGTIDIGCYEFDVSQASCGLTAEPTVLFEGGELSFASVVYGLGDPDSLTYEWTLVNGQGVNYSLAGRTPSKKIDEAGWYDVTLTVRNGSGATATQTRPRYIHVAARTNHLASAGASVPAYPWKPPGTAANTLDDLLAEAIDGTVIRVGEGEYERLAETVLEDIKIIGAGFDKTVFYRGNGAARQRLFTLNHPDALLEGVTIRGSAHKGEDGENGYGDYGNGVWIGNHGGTLRACRVTECKTDGSFYHKGAVGVTGEKGLVTHCIIDHNTNENGSGGGLAVKNGLAENCLIFDNWSPNGGGLYMSDHGTVRNCTIVGNKTEEKGGAVFWDTDVQASLQNVIFAGNQAPNDAAGGSPNWYAPNAKKLQSMQDGMVNCLFAEGATAGTGACSGDPAFRDAPNNDFSLLAGSAAIDKGTNYENMAETDLEGAPRLQNEIIDIGCHEYDTSALSCGFSATPLSLFEGEEVALEATVYGASDADDIQYEWVLKSREGKTVTADGKSARRVIPDAGWYDVTLNVTDGATGIHMTLTRPAVVHVAAPVMYLAADHSTPAYPWDTEGTAANDISALVAEAIDGSVIHVGEGEFQVTNEVCLTCAVEISGKGMDKSVFVPASSAMTRRLFYLNHPDALLQGITVKGARHSGPYYDDGGGVLIAPLGGTVRQCRVTGCTGNTLFLHGSLAVVSEKGLISGCIVDSNTNKTTGGTTSAAGIFLRAGVAENCLVARNFILDGTGGLCLNGNGIARNCTVVGNISTGKGDSSCGAGVVIMNRTGDGGIVNCLFAGNTATMVNNRTAGWPEWYISKGEGNEIFRNCFFSDSAPVGQNAVTGDPLLVNPLAGDYALAKDSPARDKGLFEPWMTEAVDLDGRPRVDHKTDVDIGCYEVPFIPPGTLMLLR